MKNRLFLSAALFLLLTSFSHSQGAPPPPPPPSSESSVADKSEFTGDVKRDISLKARFIDLQTDGSLYINKLLKELRGGFHPGTFLTVILFSFAYGVIHTLGPGHGKLIVLSYFMQRERKTEDAVVLSVIVSLIHASGAVILAVLFRTLLSGIQGAERIAFQYGFSLFSGLLLTGLGVYYLIKRIVEGNSHNHKEIPLCEESANKGLWARNLAAGFSIGIVPCPLSLAIMTISIVSGIFWVGISSVVALTLSMTLVLFGISFYTIKTRNMTLKASDQRVIEKRGKILPLLFGYLGNISMIVIGLYICYRGLISMAVWRS